MKIYKYARVRPHQYVELYSTDPQVVETILGELKTIIGTYGFMRKTEDFSGRVFDCCLHHLHGKDYEVGMWIVQQLCERGWEPFAASDTEDNYEYIHLRLEVEA